jgi:hypothetical protein
MADPNAFAKLIPGFDFMQGLMKGAGNSLPGVSQWIAPTLDPEELEKRIRDLRTVQFWLEQNAKMLGATIQALEVQRMTLATLSTMNVPMDALRESMTMRTATAPTPAPVAAPSPPAPAPAPADEPDPEPAAPAAATPAADPMQWWSALTHQFSELAANAMKDLPTATAPAKAAVTPARQRPAAKKASARKSAPAKRPNKAVKTATRKR